MKNPQRTVEIRNPSGWTITIDGERIRITGGSHDDAFAPVEVCTAMVAALIVDIQQALRAAVEPDAGQGWT